ncbi:FHA domain-containing protein [Nocardioides speluncae]|uniref:FHA domain-containing protein n=1 Tax=Nocardioides speluncae TaxID=2670337 RepID=UPI000D6922E0|nr:FHA domain-containing protein [Nocardioides speluncae]
MSSSVRPRLRVAHSGTASEFNDDTVVLGRDRNAGVVVSHDDVSRRHLEFRRSGDQWFLVDLGSTNGTFVNGRRITHEAIQPGQPVTLLVGGMQGVPVQVEILSGGQPAAPQAPPAAQPQQFSGQPGYPSQPHTPHVPAPPQAPPMQTPPVQAPPPYQPPMQQPMHSSQPQIPGGYPPAPQGGPQGWQGGPPPQSYSDPRGQYAVQPPPGQYEHGHTILPSNRQAGTLTIGRTRTNDVVIDDALVSRQHATLQLGNPAILTDLNSFNGTYVNGQRVQGSVKLGPGAEVMFGNQTFVWDGVQLTVRATRNDLTLFVEGITKVVDSGRKKLLDGVTFQLEPSSLTAVIGPSGAGKSTLLGAVTGLHPASSGNVIWQGHDLYTHYEQLRFQIGLVPQQDIQHPQLTVRQGLSYASMLRLPPDTSKQERAQRVDHVVGQMQLHRQIDNRIGTQLSGGQKKRVSIATELLTAPPLLFLDEPTSGLDPGLDRDVMNQLRKLADEGRVVMVVTHSVLALDVCNNVVVMAPGGKVAYFGPPSGVLAHFGVSDYPQVFDVLDSPDLWQRIPPPKQAGQTGPLPAMPAGMAPPPHQSMMRQLTTLVKRDLSITVADKLLLAMLLLMPLVLGGLSRVVPGDLGLSLPSRDYTELKQRLTILIVAAALMGTAVTIRELVKERAIFQREYAVGLSPGMYLLSKVMVLGTACFWQGVLVTFLATVGLPGPNDKGVLSLGWLEIAVAIGFTSFTMAVIGLAISALVTSSEQTMPTLVGLVMLQLVLSGALLPVDGRPVLEQLAWLAPARWGYAASATSVDFNLFLTPEAAEYSGLYSHTVGQWVANMTALVVLCGLSMVMAFIFVRRSSKERY